MRPHNPTCIQSIAVYPAVPILAASLAIIPSGRGIAQSALAHHQHQKSGKNLCTVATSMLLVTGYLKTCPYLMLACPAYPPQWSVPIPQPFTTTESPTLKRCLWEGGKGGWESHLWVDDEVSKMRPTRSIPPTMGGFRPGYLGYEVQSIETKRLEHKEQNSLRVPTCCSQPWHPCSSKLKSQQQQWYRTPLVLALRERW